MWNHNQPLIRMAVLSMILITGIADPAHADVVYELVGQNIGSLTVTGTITIPDGTTGPITEDDITASLLFVNNGMTSIPLIELSVLNAESSSGTLTVHNSELIGVTFLRFEGEGPATQWTIFSTSPTILTRIIGHGTATAEDQITSPYTFATVVTPVPEPTTLTMLGTGLGLMGLAGWRRRRTQTQSSNH